MAIRMTMMGGGWMPRSAITTTTTTVAASAAAVRPSSSICSCSALLPSSRVCTSSSRSLSSTTSSSSSRSALSSSLHPASSSLPSSSSSSFSSSSSSFSSSSPSIHSLTIHTASPLRTFATSTTSPNVFPVDQALNLLKACWVRTAVDTVELVLNLGLDPRKPNQSVRGVTVLPYGTGQQIRIAVFARGEKAVEARAAGADVVGDVDLAERILAGEINFDRCIATPDMMGVVGRVARVLGPRGLMPNPKVGTVTADVSGAVAQAKQGQAEFKTDKAGIVHAPVGKISFTNEQLYANISALVNAVLAAKPSGAKGQYLQTAFLHSTNGPAVPLDIKYPPFKTVTVRMSQEERQAARLKAASAAAGVSSSAKSVSVKQ